MFYETDGQTQIKMVQLQSGETAEVTIRPIYGGVYGMGSHFGFTLSTNSTQVPSGISLDPPSKS
jgi:hypothetical protein